MIANVIFAHDTFWLPQSDMAELFRVKIPAISKHLKNIYESNELNPESTVSKMEIVQTEGERTVTREIEVYNLDATIAVGYRVNSIKAKLKKLNYFIKSSKINSTLPQLAKQLLKSFMNE